MWKCRGTITRNACKSDLVGKVERRGRKSQITQEMTSKMNERRE
jgi:hypothetical protein